MQVEIKQTELRQSNGWKQVARVEVDLSLAGDGSTPQKAKDALTALNAAYRKVKAELERMSKDS